MGEQPNTPPESAAAKRDGGDEKILPRAERIRRRRAERRNADIQNAQTDRDDHAGRDDGGDDLAPVLGRQAQHAFKAAADDDRADHDAVILRGRRKTGGEEREADAHDDRQTWADLPDGVELQKRADTGDEHAVLQQPRRLNGGEGFALIDGDRGNDDERRDDRVYQRH